MERPDSTQRKNFNPEAASFSPTPGAAMTDSPLTGHAQGQHSTLAAGESAMLNVDSPLRSMAPSVGQLFGSLTALGPGYAQLMGRPHQHIEMRGQEVRRTQCLPDLDELTTSLGLPGAKPIVDAGVPQQADRKRPQDSTEGRLASNRAGKLLGRALNKPLTAVSLAAYLKDSSNSSEETVTAARHDRATLTHNQSPQKIVLPPPGHANQTPRMVVVENSLAQAPAQLSQGLSSVPAGHMQHYDHHATVQTTPLRAYMQPRRYTRTYKRSDQGPLPSAADIYPDDSEWTPKHTPQHLLAHHNLGQGSPSTRFHVDNAINWPTPAEVYTPRDATSAIQDIFNTLKLQESLPPQQTDQLLPGLHPQEPPTKGDMNALDEETIGLIEELSRLSFITMATFGALDPKQDNPHQTTLQEDMMRYGLTGTGIGVDWLNARLLGAAWVGAADVKGSWENPQPFKIRPRDHQGWGGWEWAMRNGWGEE